MENRKSICLSTYVYICNSANTLTFIDRTALISMFSTMRLFDDKHFDNFGHVLHLKLAKCVKEIHDLFLVFTKLYREVKSADISLPRFTMRSSHRCVWCEFGPKQVLLAGVPGIFSRSSPVFASSTD